MSEANGQSIQSDVLDAVVTILGGAGASVYRTRFTPFGPAELPSINVLPEDETAEYVDTDSTGLRHRFHLRHTMASNDGVDKVADLRYTSAYKLLLADPTLGGLVRWTRYIGRKWDGERGETDTIALVVTYEVEFSTKRNDPSSPGY